MNSQPTGLVHDKEVIVLEHNIERDFDWRKIVGFRLRQGLDFNARSFSQPVAWLRDLNSVDRNESCLDRSRYLRAACPFDAICKKGVKASVAICGEDHSNILRQVCTLARQGQKCHSVK